MATDIMAKATLATKDADLQTQLGLKAFLQALPRNIGRELRRRHFESVKEALVEARFLQSIEEEENCESGKIFAVEREPLEEGLKVEIKQIVKDCLKEMQVQQPKKEQSERPMASQKKLKCWCCEKKGHVMRDCPVAKESNTTHKQKDNKKRMSKCTNGCQMFPKSCPYVPKGTNRHQEVSVRPKGYPRVTDGTDTYQLVPECTKMCQSGPSGTRMTPKLGKAPRGSPMLSECCPRVPKGAKRYQLVPESAKGCHRVPDGAGGYQLVSECTKVHKSGPIEAVVSPELDQTPNLIFVTVSVAGVEVVALVDTGATISCCRWEWYLKYQDHLGGVIKSNMRVVGVDSYPLKTRGLTKPLTLLWDGVGGKCQFRILTDLSDVDVVLGMDILSWYNVEIDFRKQIARPARAPCTLSKPKKAYWLPP